MLGVSGIALIFFYIGMSIHTLAQVDAIARARNNPQTSRLSIIKGAWISIISRGSWATAFFVLILQGELGHVLTALQIPIPDVLSGILGIHIGGALAWCAGYLSDSALAFIPGLKSSIPPPIDSVQESLATAAVANIAAGDAIADAQVSAEAKK